jgi:hypothetical protein
MPIYYSSPYPYQQYSGIWKLSDASQNVGQGAWSGMLRLYASGPSSGGQLGNGSTVEVDSPVQIGATTQWKAIGAGASSSSAFGILNTGALYAWGSNAYGQLGLGNTTNYSSPKQIGLLTSWLSISSSNYHTTAIKTDGTLWAWGNNAQGQLGLNNRTAYSSPIQVGALTNWLNVSAGYSSTLAVKTDGTLWAWGYNANGQLGTNNRTSYSSPKQVGALTTWSTVFVAYKFTLAKKTDGTLWSWGQNQFGQLGLNSATSSYSSPKQVGALTNWLNFSAGNYHSIASKSDGTLWSWGRNTSGQLGLGNSGSGTYKSSPAQIGALTTWLKVSAGGYFSTAIKTDGTLWSWGAGGTGQLGLNVVAYYSSPKQVGNSTSWSSIYNGANNLYALQTS